MSSSALAAGLRHLRRQLAAQQTNEQCDEQLLHLFLTRRDDSAFAALMHRHGPMVLHVCRRVLGHQQDAEDAFQATFLVLARQATKLRKRASLASWLYGIAHRIALKAKQAAARRRKHESRTPARLSAEPSAALLWDEVRALLDDEIARLPEKYRSVFVLFYLEECGREQISQRLGLKAGTVASRLAEARKRLQGRLSRRGVELTAVLAASALATPSTELMANTIEAALATEGISATVAELVQGATTGILVNKAKMATVLLLAAALLAGAGWWRMASESGLVDPEPASSQGTFPAPQAPREENPKSVAVGGRVLGPDGKPVRGARLYLPLLKDEQRRPLATSDDAGRFRFTVMPAEVRYPRHLSEPWRYIHVMAVAEGYGPAVAAVGDPSEAGKLTLRLAKDDVTIEGRILDLQGKPVAGATIQVDGLGVPTTGDLTEFLKDLKGRSGGYAAEGSSLMSVELADHARLWPTVTTFARLWPTATTDAEGRFQIKGVGGERLAHLTISGPTIETRRVRVRTRPGETIAKLAWADAPDSTRVIYYGSEFEHVAAPTKPIVGVVRDKSTGKPLAKVIVRSYKLAGDGLHGNGFIHTVTDKDGRYRLVGMPKGDGNMIVAEPPASYGYQGDIRTVALTAHDLDPVTADFDLRRGVFVQGRVTDKKTGAGVEAHIEYFVFNDNPARREYRGSLYFRHLITEPDGAFQKVVPHGHGLLAARASNDQYLVGMGAEKIEERRQGDSRFLLTDPPCDPASHHRLLEINPGKDDRELTCRLEVDPGQTLNGVIVGPDGQPLAGARICGVRSYYWEHEPLPTAKFAVHALAPDRPRNLLVVHEGKRLAGSLVVRGDEKGPVTIELQPGGTIAGRLVTVAGDSYTKGRLDFGFPLRRDDLTIGGHPQHNIPRDKQGRFRVEGLIPGLKYHLMLSSSGRVQAEKEFTVSAGETKDLGARNRPADRVRAFQLLSTHREHR